MTRRIGRRGIGVLVACSLAVVGLAATAGAAPSNPKVAVPTVEGPVTTGKGISLVTTSAELLAPKGYVADEFFQSGTATAYQPAKPLTEDGHWKLGAVSTEPYKTRMVVDRPTDPKKFNGTVFVEWLNTSAGFDTSAAWNLAHNEIMRSGAAWVGVSAQAGGIQGTDLVLSGAAPRGVRGADPERYGSLHHPGDLYSFDIFSQTGLAARGDAKGVEPLDGLHAKRVIAMGDSQSGFRLVSYVDGVHPLAHVYDGFLIESRHASGSPLGKSSFGLADPTVPKVTLIRTDTDVPVFVVQTESDVAGFSSANARQPDTKRFRLWEIAGAAHANTYSGGPGLGDNGDGTAEHTILDPANLSRGPLNCTLPVNSGPQFAVASAATSALDRWVRTGTPPATAPRLKTSGTDPVVIARDAHGNALGGVRTPLVDVPLATNTGNRNGGGTFCSLYGTSAAFDAATVASLYPTQADYVKKFDASTDEAVKAGFLLRPEADNFKKAAASLNVG